VVPRRGRGKTVCARGARSALPGGPSTSPLDGMPSLTATLTRRATLVALVVIIAPPLLRAQASPPESSDVSMVLSNADGPFVTADFARKLGTLVMQQKYPGFTFASESPAVLDKGDTWWVTFTVKDWPKNMEKLRPGLSDHLTLWIRKRDAAILAIR
jgi:hypothetical protein